MARIVGWRHQNVKYSVSGGYTRYGPQGIEKVKTVTLRDGRKARIPYRNGRQSGQPEIINVHHYGNPRMRIKRGNRFIRRPLLIRRR